MKRLKEKLRQTHGETLVETLAAILILALSSAMLAVMCNMAVNINKQAADANYRLYREISIAEQAAGTEKITVKLVFPDATISVNQVEYTGSENELYSYKLIPKEDR